MDREKFYIDMPDEITIQNEINIILDKGLKEKQSFYKYIKNMYNQIGLKNLFHDAIEIIFVVLVALGIFTLIVLQGGEMNYREVNKIYVFIMIISPILYLVLSLISFISTKERRTYEIEMTCKYNLYQLSVLRMLIFSIVCILFNVAVIGTIVIRYKEINFIRAFMISSTSLFLFSYSFLYLALNVPSRVTKYLVIIGWIFINSILCFINIDLYMNILMSLPIVVYVAVTVTCVYFYIKKLKEFIKFTSIKGVM
ncbi:membrane protein [Clostridium botulinum]|uniref:Membrane protein n=1 Tax=Clostridium botulinum TaxID=1491 RepID=A0A9Q1ZBF1_CLOBO|nr:hypothetical protein [Clostridium botulinum]AEB74975.1 membrane protein, putative [Clostridium botulinum BKT015925]KEI02254.1 membrane protein [Clostridium botulinum C/D str. Sp77]KEI03639.1 membrane protein [Clostridium botulinum D str. 16868]KOA78877.1 membrane protein [Clostridium botulinum]KOA81761.1 membrane protein [Clostridium botulinum]